MTNEKYTLGKNSCDCHPETCHCADYAIYEEGKKYIPVFDRPKGEHIVNALNLLDKLQNQSQASEERLDSLGNCRRGLDNGGKY
ncbi:MAG: hypothetical protein PVJ67_01840 [Candidatus Pacearchaeota archaeon]|jgi:hypothetical protein